MNNLYNSLNQNSMQNQFSQFVQNPFQFVMQKRGIAIPQQFQNDPRGAIQHMLNNGQMSQPQLNKITQIAQMMGVKLT